MLLAGAVGCSSDTAAQPPAAAPTPEGLHARCLSAIPDATTQVDVAAAYARDELGATRVVLVGASMGGSQTVRAVAGGAKVDAWVDVSGPSAWDGDDLIDLADRLTPQGLVVMARSDGDAEWRAAQDLAGAAKVPFVDAPGGHGWTLVTTPEGDALTPVGEQILAFADQ